MAGVGWGRGWGGDCDWVGRGGGGLTGVGEGIG